MEDGPQYWEYWENRYMGETDETGREKGRSFYADSSIAVETDSIPFWALADMREFFGGEDTLEGKRLYERNGHLLYVIYVNGQKQGWYVLTEGEAPQMYDEKAHSALFEPGKIDAPLRKQMDSMKEDEIVQVVLTLADVDEDEAMARFQTQYPDEFAVYTQQAEDEITVASIHDAIAAKRGLYRHLYRQNNRPVAQALVAYGAKLIFQSAYSPLCIMQMTKGAIEKAVQMSQVMSISQYFENGDGMEQQSAGPASTHPEFLQPTSGPPYSAPRDVSFLVMHMKRSMLLEHTGEDVKIGMMDISGVDAAKAELAGRVTNMWGDTEQNKDSHATRVALLIAGEDTGTAPQAQIYATYINETSFYSEMEWLLTQGVSIINISMYAARNGRYNLLDKWMDFIVSRYDVHVVKSAGNTGQYISSPGLAFNAVTVGNLNAHNGLMAGQHEVNWNSSWVEEPTAASKPDLIAPGSHIEYEHSNGKSKTYHGTSYSAAYVSGAIAMLISKDPTLAVRPAAVKAIVMAGAWEKARESGYGLEGCPYLSDKEDAGKLNCRSALYIVENERHFAVTMPAGTDTFKKTLYISADTVQTRMAVCWNKKNAVSAGQSISEACIGDVSMDDLDLKVYNPQGELIAHSYSTNNNVELVDFKPDLSGGYTVEISRHNNLSSDISFAFAYW
ncbi:MAG: S8 family peptidase [Christensenellales bacterium]